MNHRAFFNLVSASMAALAFSTAPASAQESGAERTENPTKPFTVYGYALSGAEAAWLEDGNGAATTGAALTVRLKTDWNPSDRLFFHMEIRSLGRYGTDNDYALYDYLGIPVYLGSALQALTGASADSGDLYPYEDFHWSLAVDHAYARANFEAFDLAFGKLPIAWGTAYVFNPTAKTSPASGPDPESEETPGILAFSPSLALGKSVSLQGYLAFQERSLRNRTGMDEGNPANLPFGAKISAVIGSFDLSASFLREVAYYESLSGTASFRRRAYAGLDFSGGVGAVGLYGEASLGLPARVAYGTGPEDFDPVRDLELSAGFDWTIPEARIDLRGEYYYRGAGADDTDGYDPTEILNGTSFVLGKHYVFLFASRTFADYWTLTLAALANAADGSWVLLPKLVWDAASDLELRLEAVLPFGPPGSEFNGEYDLTAYGLEVVDLLYPAIRASAKLSF